MRQRQSSQPALLWQRLAAIAYDSILLFSVIFCATWVMVLGHGGEAFSRGTPLHGLYEAVLLGLGLGYFLWPWTHGGQTLGMGSWRLRLVDAQGQTVGWPRALLRLALAPLSWLPMGLGFLWSLVDPQGLAWHDRLSGTRLIRTE